MNENVKGAAATLALAAVLAVAVIDGGTKPEAGAKRAPGARTMLAVKPDGGKGYVVLVELDGGVQEVREAATPGCVRRPQGAPPATCRRRTEDGGVVDPGDLNRFAEADAVGPGCQPVACTVFIKEDAEEDEDARIVRERGGK